MSRIDAIVSTQVGDIVRPVQTQLEGRAQVQEAQLAGQVVEPGVPPQAHDLRAIAAQLKQVIEAASSRRLTFSIDDTTKTLVATVSDQASGEVITQIPSEDILRMHQRISALIGTFIDEKA